MRINRISSLFFLLFITPTIFCQSFVEDLVVRTVEGIYRIGSHIKENVLVKGLINQKGDLTLTEISSEVMNIMKDIREIKDDTQKTVTDATKALFRKLSIDNDLRVSMNTVFDYLDYINSTNTRFSDLFIASNETGSTILRDFCEAAVAESEGGLINKLSMIDGQINGRANTRKKLFHLLRNHIKENQADICDDPVSPQQRLYNILRDILGGEITATTNIVSCYAYLHLKKYGDYAQGAEIALSTLKNRLKNYITDVNEVLKEIPREIRRCDPSNHKRGETYVEFSRLFQGVLIDDHVNPTCGQVHTCKVQSSSVNKKCNDDLNDDCLGMIYNGDFRQCIIMGHEVQICNARSASRRHYEWVKKADGQVYGGDLNGCTNHLWRATAHSVNSWFTNTKCQYCLCIYTEAHWTLSTVRAVSFLWQRAKVSDNRVIVGVRFIEKNGLIHVQAKQGKLMPFGKIKDESWVPIDGFQLETTEWTRTLYDNWHRPIQKAENVTTLYYLPSNDYRKQLYRFEHYAYLTQDSRTFNLNNVVVPDDHVIVGVRFRYVNDLGDIVPSDVNIPIEIEVEAVPFDYLAGKITLSTNNRVKYYRGSKSMDYWAKRKEVVLHQPDNSINAASNELSTEPHLFVKLQASDYEKDAGQSTVPFFDAQPVEARPAVPLNGIGIYHRGCRGCGGFVGLRIVPHNITDYVNLDLSQINNISIANVTITV